MRTFEEDSMRFESIHRRPDDSRVCGRRVVVEFDGVPSLPDALGGFEDFLRGNGFNFEGEVTIDREEE